MNTAILSKRLRLRKSLRSKLRASTDTVLARLSTRESEELTSIKQRKRNKIAMKPADFRRRAVLVAKKLLGVQPEHYIAPYVQPKLADASWVY